MKELSEYTEEVLRRAAAKRAARRRRLTTAALCVGAAALVIAVLPVIKLVKEKSPDNGSQEAYSAPTDAPVDIDNGLPEIEGVDSVPELSCTVAGLSEEEAKSLSPEDAAEMRELIAAVFASPGEVTDEAMPETEGGWVLVLTENGESVRYTLTGNELKNEATGETRTLTEEQLSRLAKLIAAAH